MAKKQDDLMSTLLESGMKQLSKKLEKELKNKVSQTIKEATGASAKSDKKNDKKTDSKKKDSKTSSSAKKKESKTSSAKTGAKASAAKASSSKTSGTLSKALKPKVIYELGTKKYTADELVKLAEKDAVKQEEGTIKKLEIRVNTDKDTVYYLVNDSKKKYELLGCGRDRKGIKKCRVVR